MYSKEFMKFIYNYQKDDFKPKDAQSIEIRFDNQGGNGKLAEVYITVESNK